MVVNFEDESVRRGDEQAIDDSSPRQATEAFMSDAVEEQELSAIDLVLGLGQPQRVGRFRFFFDGERWEWSEVMARMHGYEPGLVQPSTELLLQHKHPEDRDRAAVVLEHVLKGEPISSRYRIVDAAGRTRTVVVVGDRMVDDTGKAIGTTGFYVDVTESLSSDITTVLTKVAASRARIEQAKGVLMAVYGISAERAFDILVWRSQEANLKLRDLAANFLKAIEGKASSQTMSHVDHALLTVE